MKDVHGKKRKEKRMCKDWKEEGIAKETVEGENM